MQVKFTLANQSVAGMIFSKMSPRSFSLSLNRTQSSLSLEGKKQKTIVLFETVFTLWQAVQGDDILSYDGCY